MKRMKRKILWRSDVAARVIQMAERGTAASERLASRAVEVVYSMGERGPPPNTTECGMRDSRPVFEYRIDGVRFLFHQDNNVIELVSIEFIRER